MSALLEPAYDLAAIRAQFPALHQDVHGKPLVWLDTAATSQKPQGVIDAVAHYYAHDNANVHRGVHALAERATRAFEDARTTTARFLNAAEAREVIFTRGTTEAINLVANSFGASLRAGDEIILSNLEHHSNIVPWQLLRERTGIAIRVIPINDAGELDLDAFRALLSERTRLVSVVHVSNALGTVNPIAEIVRLAHAAGAKVLVDGAQALSHVPVDVQALDVDFYAFSGHKAYAPTGIGGLYGKAALLSAMPPWMGGGDMIDRVTFEYTTFAEIPARFEARTPNVGGAVGLGAALKWVEANVRPAAFAHEDDVLRYGTAALQAIPGLRIVGTAAQKVAVLSFVVDGVHPHDLASVLDRQGVAIRTGHHCTQPLMDRLGVTATARASLGCYSGRSDVDRLVVALEKAIHLLR